MIRPLLTLAAIALSMIPAWPAGDPPAGRAVAVTFDDLPCVPAEGSTAELQVDINHRIVATLVDGNIPAVGFVNEIRLEQNAEVVSDRVAALALWLDAGLELGNHSYSHPSLHGTPLDEWLADVKRGERVTRHLLAEHGRELRWFRHPFLHTGLDLDTKLAAESALAERGVSVAPVTIDNSEWIFARAYLLADEASDAEAGQRIADAYVAYMEAKVEYYERQSKVLFDREIPQVLLLHANRLNADHFGRIATMLERRGYRFVSLEEAVADEAYRSADTYTGRGGITWLHRWALSLDPRGEIVKDEPRTPKWIMAAAGVESE
jgi:peptidoglycan/xylan/chitin deacetylase (PgdA/CDA1 family)